MNSTRTAVGIVIPIVVAAIWGYFADLREGDLGSFVRRVVFVAGVAIVVNWLLASRKRRGPSDSDRR